MVEYYAQDEGTRTQIDNLWHEGYMRGLGQVDWEYDVTVRVNYNRGYKEALDKAFPNGDYPQYVNYPPREVSSDAIKTPEFDNKLEGLKDNTEVVDQLNDKIKQIKERAVTYSYCYNSGVGFAIFLDLYRSFLLGSNPTAHCIDLTAITAQDGLWLQYNV